MAATFISDSLFVFGLYVAGYGSLAVAPAYLLVTLGKERRFKKRMIWTFSTQIFITGLVWVAVDFFQNPYLFIYLVPVGLVGWVYYSFLLFRRLAGSKDEKKT